MQGLSSRDACCHGCCPATCSPPGPPTVLGVSTLHLSSATAPLVVTLQPPLDTGGRRACLAAAATAATATAATAATAAVAGPVLSMQHHRHCNAPIDAQQSEAALQTPVLLCGSCCCLQPSQVTGLWLYRLLAQPLPKGAGAPWGMGRCEGGAEASCNQRHHAHAPLSCVCSLAGQPGAGLPPAPPPPPPPPLCLLPAGGAAVPTRRHPASCLLHAVRLCQQCHGTHWRF